MKAHYTGSIFVPPLHLVYNDRLNFVHLLTDERVDGKVYRVTLNVTVCASAGEMFNYTGGVQNTQFHSKLWVFLIVKDPLALKQSTLGYIYLNIPAL